MLGFLWIDECERQRADAFLRGEVDRVAPRARHPKRRVRLLHRLGNDVPRRHLHVLAVDAGERHFGHAADGDLEPLLPHLAFEHRVDVEPAELGFGGRLAGAELDATVRHEVEHGDAFGNACRVVERGRRLHDAVAEPDVRRPLRARGEEHLGRARVAVLLEEVVLDFPHDVEAQLVSQLDLIERVVDELLLAVLRPRPRQLVLVEDAEFHERSVLAQSVKSPGYVTRSMWRPRPAKASSGR